jgi:hypothetical protein
LVEVQEMIAKKTPKKKWLLKKAPAKKAVAKKPAAKKPAVKPVAKKEIKWSLILEPINTETLELIHGLTSQQLGVSCFHTKEQFRI